MCEKIAQLLLYLLRVLLAAEIVSLLADSRLRLRFNLDQEADGGNCVIV